MAKSSTGESGFPGFQFLEGFFELWTQGASDLVGSMNTMWENALDPDGTYSFGTWVRDMAQASSASYRNLEKMARYPVVSALSGAPPWATIVAGKGAESASSLWIDLPKSVSQQEPSATGLERLGTGTQTIESKYVHLELNDTRDRLRVSISDLKALANKKSSLPSGTYVGFAKQAGASGPPLAVIFLSYDE